MPAPVQYKSTDSPWMRQHKRATWEAQQKAAQRVATGPTPVAPKQSPIAPNRTHLSTNIEDIKQKSLDIASTYGKIYGEKYARKRLSGGY
jgi:hypothetical protein